MQADAPPAEGPPLQRRALRPAMLERDFGEPILNPCVFSSRDLADGPGNAPEPRQVLVATNSGLTFLLNRVVKTAIYGEVYDGLQITIDGDHFVRLVDERGLDRRVAIKMMSWKKITELEERGDVMENPLREIAAVVFLSEPGHPNVLRKLEALSNEQYVFLVTPFIDGGDGTDIATGEMFDWVASRGGVPEDSVREVFRQIVEGMRYMHSMGVCHADMSLENALIDRDGRPYIIDFGMSLLMPIAEDGRRCMSVSDPRSAKKSYCSPEVNKNKAYDGVKVDVFGAGAMLFMMLLGFPPFQVASRADSAFKKIVWEGDVQGLLRSYGFEEVSADAAHLLSWMMAYKPEKRPMPEEVLAHRWFNPPPPPAAANVAEAAGGADPDDPHPAGVEAVA